MNSKCKVSYSPYSLISKNALNAKAQNSERLGALLKFEFSQIGIGYADCHPWPEFGDDPLHTQLFNYSQNTVSSLMQKSIYFAKIDAKFRAEKKSVFENKVLSKNRFTSSQLLSKSAIENINSQGFEQIKFKCGFNLENEIEYLLSIRPILKDLQIKIFLDCNSNLNLKEAQYLFQMLEPIRDYIGAIEDPIAWNEIHWQKLKEQFSIPLALDRVIDKNFNKFNLKNNCIDYLTVKPAYEKIPQNFMEEKKSPQLIFTSNMDHPLGQLCAQYDAIEFFDKYNQNSNAHMGFLTQNQFIETPYSRELQIKNAKLCAPTGTGFGFNSLLEKENWKELK